MPAITKTYDPKTGQLTETPLTPEQLAALQATSSALYLPNGRTRRMEQLMQTARSIEPAKPKLRRAA